MGAPRANPPLPPAELIAYTYGVNELDGLLERYEREGAALRGAVLSALGSDWSWRGKRVLDFGCGAGRVLRQFLDVANVAELHGAELDEACVGWLQSNLSASVRVVQSSERPPLPYPDEHFDLVWAIWVFTHLTDSWAAWLLELMSTGRLAGRPIGECSDGERARVLIARALMPAPRLLLLDEPSAGLDMAGREDLLAGLADLSTSEPALASVVVSHHLEDLPPTTTHAMLLAAGRALASGPVDEVLQDATVSRCFGVGVRILRTGRRWAAVHPEREPRPGREALRG